MPDQAVALLVFTIGALVTLATVVMVIRGHLHWRGREPWSEP